MKVTINWGGKEYSCEMGPVANFGVFKMGQFKELEIELWQDVELNYWECLLNTETTFSGVSRYGNSAQEAVNNLYEFLQEECLYLTNLMNPK